MLDPKSCEVCHATNLTLFLKVEDHLVSGKEFALYKCPRCQLLHTSPQPQANQLEKYYKSNDYISHTNKATNPITFLYKLVRHYTINRKRLLLNKYSVKQTVLDIGCGTGHFLHHMEKHGWKVSGVEPDDQAREIAQKQIGGPLHSEIESCDKNQYSVITLWHVLEHLPALHDMVSLFKKMLNKNGTIFVAVPNYTSYDAKHYSTYWAGYDVPRHLYHFSKLSMEYLVKEHDLRIQAILPMFWDAFYVSLLSEKYKNSAFQLYHAIKTGFLSNQKGAGQKNTSSLIYVIKHAKK